MLFVCSPRFYQSIFYTFVHFSCLSLDSQLNHIIKGLWYVLPWFKLFVWFSVNIDSYNCTMILVLFLDLIAFYVLYFDKVKIVSLFFYSKKCWFLNFKSWPLNCFLQHVAHPCTQMGKMEHTLNWSYLNSPIYHYWPSDGVHGMPCFWNQWSWSQRRCFCVFSKVLPIYILLLCLFLMSFIGFKINQNLTVILICFTVI